MIDAMRLYAPEECTGADGYPPQWHESIKHAVRDQAGHRCVRCSHPYRRGGEWSPCDEQCTHSTSHCRIRPTPVGWPMTPRDILLADREQFRHEPRYEVDARWRILTVHHLDGNKANCRWWNLAALCQRCHLTIQDRVDMCRIYPWPHSDWFRPYAAGYCAWVYLGEKLSREETEARLDELLGLELAGGGL